MKNTIDTAPFSRSTIGFERLLSQLGALDRPDTADDFPPYDIERSAETRYRITLSVAGFGEADLSITIEANQLTVAGRKPNSDGHGYLYHGIRMAPFTHRFSLADYVTVKEAWLLNGLLVIELEHQIPESMKARRVPIAIQASQPANAQQAA